MAADPAAALSPVRIEVSGGVDEGGILRFVPGDMIHGQVHLATPGEIGQGANRAQKAIVRLAWHTEGRGMRDEGTAEESVIHEGTLDAVTPLTHSFSFTAPDGPWSHVGHYVTIVWEVVVSLDVPWAPDVKHSVPIAIRPNEGKNRALQPMRGSVSPRRWRAPSRVRVLEPDKAGLRGITGGTVGRRAHRRHPQTSSLSRRET